VEKRQNLCLACPKLDAGRPVLEAIDTWTVDNCAEKGRGAGRENYW
jgi:hypothetical protein